MDLNRNEDSDEEEEEEWDEADEPSGHALRNRNADSQSPTGGEAEGPYTGATMIFPDLPNLSNSNSADDPQPTPDNPETQGESQEEGQASDQVTGLPELDNIPKAEEEDEKEEEDDRGRGRPKKIRGDEALVIAEGKLPSDIPEKTLPEDFFYDYEELISKPRREEDSELPPTMLTLSHSYGYDCTRRANIQVIDHDTVVYMAGTFLVILNVRSKKQTVFRSTGGRGLGAIAAHPFKTHLAVGETGHHPDINVFEYPSFKLFRILRGGADKSYAYLDFSPHGSLVASMAGEPDYMLTLWNWKQEQVVLRCKAFSQDVFRARFSTEFVGQLTSSGVGHIRFWKMARTFTGLKLQGELGRFGKKEISDIEGYVELPDGKVLSSSESGNMLLWDGGLCINEISRKGKKPCHQGPIQQIIMDEGELFTVGVDGYVRMWDFETQGSLEESDEVSGLELDPINELRVGNDVQLTSLVKSCGTRETSMWYAQDANGGIWKLDLSFQFTSLQPEFLMSYHAGPIFSCGTSPVANLVATVGNDGTVRVYDYMARALISSAKFSSGATSFLWLPKTLDPDGTSVFAGFNDGVIRLLGLQKNLLAEVRKNEFKYELNLVFAVKPHNSSVTCIEMDHDMKLLVTGSSDATIFFFDVEMHYAPIGFFKVFASINHLQWSPENSSKKAVLVSCADGQVFEVEVPDPSSCDTTKSYELKDLMARVFNFESIKSQLRHEIEVEQLAKEEEEKKRLAAAEKKKLIDKGLWSPEDEEEEKEKLKAEEEKVVEKEPWQPTYPDKPSPVLCAYYGHEEGHFWASMGEYDAGYLYECCFTQTLYYGGETSDIETEKPIRAVPVVASDDVPISCVTLSQDGKYAVLGMQDGCIRIQRLTEEYDLATLGAYWILGIHDTSYGEITHLCFSHDGKFLFSTGLDGNFFAFHYETRTPSEVMLASRVAIPDKQHETSRDIDDVKALSIEDSKQKSEHERMLMLAETKKEATRQTIERMKELFQELHKRNNNLPPELRLHKKEFLMDLEFSREILGIKNNAIEELNKEMAWDAEKLTLTLTKIRAKCKDRVESEKITIRAFNSPHVVTNFRLARRSKYLKECLDSLRKIREEMLLKERTRALLTKTSGYDQEEAGIEDEKKEAKVGMVLKGSTGERLMKALAKVEERKKARAARLAQWKEFLDSRLPDDYEDPADLAAIQEAKIKMGDYNLKSSNDYVVTQRSNTSNARERVIMHKLYMYEYKHNFNMRFLNLRNKKMRIINRLRANTAKIQNIHKTIPRRQAKAGPSAPNPFPEEFPEKRYEYTRESLQTWYDSYLMKLELSGIAPVLHQLSSKQSVTHSIDPVSAGMTSAPPPPSSTPSSSAGPPKRGQMPAKPELSEIEKLMKQDDEIRLIHDQDKLIEEMTDLIRNFDADLRCMRHEKYILDISMKNAEARELVLLHELLLINDFEAEENVLVAKVDSKVSEANQTTLKITDTQNKIESHRKEIEYLLQQEKALYAMFLNAIGENKFLPFLTKVFKKRIKRSRRLMTDSDDDEESESDSDEEDDEDDGEEDEEEEEDDDQVDLDVCPPGCDGNLYNTTVALREDHVDIEEAMSFERKSRDALIKAVEMLVKNAKKVESSLDDAEKDLEIFQLKKQKALNSIDCTVIFRLHQLEYLKNGILVMDFSKALAFEDFNLTKLKKRIKELLEEKRRQKQKKKENRLLHISLVRDKHLFNKQIEKMKDICDDLMVKKFGRLVDFEKVETIVVNRELEELRQTFHDTESDNDLELLTWQNKLNSRLCKEREFLKQNTVLNEELVKMRTDNVRYANTLNNRQRNVGIERMGDLSKDIVERQELSDLVQGQLHEINVVKKEIWMLSRKEGSVFPPNHPQYRH